MMRKIIKRISEKNETLAELIVGIVVVMLLLEVGGIILAASKLRFGISVLIGTACAVLMVTHMSTTIERELYMHSEDAVKYARKSSVLRFVFMLLVLFCGVYFSVFDVIGLFLGMLTLKISVYIRPLTSKFILKKFLSKGR